MTLTSQNRYAIDPEAAKGFDTEALRRHFHVGDLFAPGEIRLVYTHYDRLILGSAVVDAAPLVLDHMAETGTPGFLDRREMGILCLADAGTVSVGGSRHEMAREEILYIGMGAGPITFETGRFYILSAPAHQSHPTRLIRHAEARRVELGAPETANERTIFQYLHPDVCDSCQLVMGITRFKAGSVWNTMPAHVHDRRMEAYLYFDIPEAQRVFHFMGQPQETRHMVIANEEAIISPPWSIHCGAGTSAYAFCWAMAGDNVDFTDMDMIAMEDLR
ncbi:5-dehydro-4-deoxy-D-glucuronate isomerase [Pseudoruegeria sp. SHC-113]|uniref:5-dehydro-4-deoxy-D-glucuronate isomerase n=1 Tax=Pseudoruegeria sp. SHC-113 TaxID=2855439 RepID=UPI0021BB1C18|nr:5-dehydro-4-deoxy-D-glucuronate isomerase [Pseudoruegeria sp. SHC-113]MCT8161311.1 5-dehydro-4-deoxy-D-glucuronate isomerase [Pseudoruegeria sp. SHC-113]